MKSQKKRSNKLKHSEMAHCRYVNEQLNQAPPILNQRLSSSQILTFRSSSLSSFQVKPIFSIWKTYVNQEFGQIDMYGIITHFDINNQLMPFSLSEWHNGKPKVLQKTTISLLWLSSNWKNSYWWQIGNNRDLLKTTSTLLFSSSSLWHQHEGRRWQTGL